MRFTDPKKPFEVDVKRFYVPGVVIECDCPNCKKPVKHDFGSEYLSDPTANATNKVHMYCPECSHEWELKVRLDVTLTLES